MTIDVVSTDWLARHLSDPAVVVVDGSYYLPAVGRDAAAEFLAAHVPGAVRFDIDAVKDAASTLPHMLPAPEVFAAAVGALGIDETMTVVAYDGMGLFAAPRTAWTFAVFGQRRVAVLDGGFPAWLKEGRPTETGTAAPREARTYRPVFDAAAVASLADVAQALETGGAQVVDARSAARFTAEEKEPRPGLRSGHMPGAINLHYAEVLRDGKLADAATIRAAMDRAGIDPGRPIVTTCGSGVTAAILSVAFERAGQPARALYDGSWSEWGSTEGTPVEEGPANSSPSSRS